jgi:Tfp pilus assembly protein PilO
MKLNNIEKTIIVFGLLLSLGVVHTIFSFLFSSETLQKIRIQQEAEQKAEQELIERSVRQVQLEQEKEVRIQVCDRIKVDYPDARTMPPDVYEFYFQELSCHLL